jgi:hypothetical protein
MLSEWGKEGPASITLALQVNKPFQEVAFAARAKSIIDSIKNFINLGRFVLEMRPL